MSQQVRVQLSALMDGELPRDETLFLLRRIEHDSGLAERWSSYHVARHTLRRQDLLMLRADFVGAVMARVDAEGAPHSAHSGSWIGWASGGAIAASVAIVALILSGPRGALDNQPGEALVGGSSATTQPVASVSARPGDFRPPMLSPALDVQPASATSGGFSAQTTPIDPRLQSYLMRHYDAAGSAGQPGLMPYVLLIVPPQQQASSDVVVKSVEQR